MTKFYHYKIKLYNRQTKKCIYTLNASPILTESQMIDLKKEMDTEEKYYLFIKQTEINLRGAYEDLLCTEY